MPTITDQAAGLISVPGWRVPATTPLPHDRLQLDFQDGTTGTVDLAALITAADAGVFESLRDPKVFAAVRVEHGAPSWPSDIDLAPDALHAAVTSGSSFPIPKSPFPEPKC